jgi:hypothetical protein
MKLVGSFYILCALFVIVVLGAVAKACGSSILRFIASIKEELLVVLGTSSSEVVLPQIMEKTERLGCSKPVVGLVIPTGILVMQGSTGFAYINNPYLPNYVQYHDFGSAGERSWQLRYDYDFAALGIPGLSFFTAYIHGDGLKKVGADKEWERDVEITMHFKGS